MPRLRSFWRSLFRRSDVERQMADELSFHIETRATDLMSRIGLSRADAALRKYQEFDPPDAASSSARSKNTRTRAGRASGCG